MGFFYVHDGPFIKGPFIKGAWYFLKNVQKTVFSSNDIASLREVQYYLRQWHFIPECNPFTYAALFLK